MVERDVADGRGQRGREIEEDLHLRPSVAAAGHRLADDEDGHEVAVREQRHRHHAAEQRELARQLGIAQIVQTRRPSLGGEPVRQSIAGREPDRVDDLRGQGPMRADAIGLARLVEQQQRRARGAEQLADGVQEHLESARQVEAGGQDASELFQDASQRRWLAHGLDRWRLADRWHHRSRAKRGDLVKEPAAIAHLAYGELEVALTEAGGQREVGALRALVGRRDGHHERRRPHVLHPRDEDGQLRGGASTVAEDDVDVDEAEGLEGVSIGRGHEHGSAREVS